MSARENLPPTYPEVLLGTFGVYSFSPRGHGIIAHVPEGLDSIIFEEPANRNSSIEMPSSSFTETWKWNMHYYMKFPQLTNAAICAVFHAKWANLVPKSVNAITPASVFFIYTLLNAYIILEFQSQWKKTSKITKQAFGLIAGLLFALAGAMDLYSMKNSSAYVDELSYQAAKLMEGGSPGNETPATHSHSTSENGILAGIGFLSLFESILYFADVCIIS